MIGAWWPGKFLTVAGEAFPALRRPLLGDFDRERDGDLACGGKGECADIQE
jgi:hypothetical protein